MAKYLNFFIVTAECKAASVLAVVTWEGHVFWAIWSRQRPAYKKEHSKRCHWKHMEVVEPQVSIPISEDVLQMLALRFLQHVAAYTDNIC